MLGWQEWENAGTEAVKRLRIDKLRQGYPFMINSKELPNNQCYLEYPNGRIMLVTTSSDSRDFVVIKELSEQESSTLRTKFKLDRIII